MTGSYRDHERPAFRHIGGDVYWTPSRGQPVYLDRRQIDAQLSLFQREHDACLRAGLRLDARVARKAFLELTDALKEQGKWDRASCLANPNRQTGAA